MTSPIPELRPSTPGDLAGIRELYRAVFQHERPYEHDVWKFQDNPDGPGIGVVAVANEKIVGQYALLPTSLRLGSQTVLGAQSLDTMTHPDFRGQGLFIKLASACIDLAAARGVKALYGFPNANSYPGFVRRLNWDHCGDIPRWVRPLRGDAYARIPRALHPLIGLGVALLPRGPHSIEGLSLMDGPPPPEDMEALLQPWREEKGFCRIDCSPSRLQWRFLGASGQSYRWVGARKAGELLSVAIWGRRSMEEATLVALLGEENELAARLVVSECLRHASAAGANRITTLTNEPRVVSILKKIGFIRRDGLPLIVRSMTHETLGGNVHEFSGWRIGASDVDTY